jgi:hypothetical protein
MDRDRSFRGKVPSVEYLAHCLSSSGRPGATFPDLIAAVVGAIWCSVFPYHAVKVGLRV